MHSEPAALDPRSAPTNTGNFRNQCPLEGGEHHSVFCPTCSTRLTDSRCKLICRTCGYFLSCADFY